VLYGHYSGASLLQRYRETHSLLFPSDWLREDASSPSSQSDNRNLKYSSYHASSVDFFLSRLQNFDVCWIDIVHSYTRPTPIRRCNPTNKRARISTQLPNKRPTGHASGKMPHNKFGKHGRTHDVLRTGERANRPCSW